MVFSSLNFLFIFLPITLLLYYICKDITWKNVILLIASLVFYAWGEPVYIILMVISILFNYLIGKDIEQSSHPKATLVFGIIVNILILGYFKYSGMLVDTINSIVGLSIHKRELALSVGISFYTFQAMSYIIDVYRKDSKAQQKILPFAVYITMFPQLIAGPIVRYEDIERQLTVRRFSGNDFSGGVLTFIKGLAQKVILANCIGAVHTEILGMTDRGAVVAWIGAIAYTLQIFNDFAGYSNMAIGLGKMLGFTFPKNFDRPYASTSVTEFWRRWHISLSSWFREYVYIPLGGNRKGTAKQIRNIAIVWMLTGIWHGASWNFVLWGVYYGMLLIVEKFVLKDILKKLPAIFRHIYTLFFVLIGWVIFAFDKISLGVQYIGSMFGGAGVGLVDNTTIYLLYNYGVLLVILILASTDLPKRVAAAVSRKIGADSWILTMVRMVFYVGIFFLGVAYLVDATYNPFLYFRF